MRPGSLFFATAFLTGCAPILRYDLPLIADVFVVERSLVYRGPISRESNQRLFDLAESIEFAPTTLIITSKGGETFAGMDLGLWVHRNALNVTVMEYCLSSCANYVFPAGSNKFLEAGAALAWHGGALQEEWGDPCSDLPRSILEEGVSCEDVQALQQEKLEEFKTAEKAFFVEIGVDQRVTVLGQYPEYDCRGDTASLGWDYSIPDMGRLGIENIIVRDGIWRPVSPAPERSICRVELGPDFS